jgi:hypothetical protein
MQTQAKTISHGIREAKEILEERLSREPFEEYRGSVGTAGT